MSVSATQQNQQIDDAAREENSAAKKKTPRASGAPNDTLGRARSNDQNASEKAWAKNGENCCMSRKLFCTPNQLFWLAEMSMLKP